MKKFLNKILNTHSKVMRVTAFPKGGVIKILRRYAKFGLVSHKKGAWS